MSIPTVENFGYQRNGAGELEFVYDFEGRLKRTLEEQVELVLKGCGCKKGCETRQCRCRKAGHSCSVGCRCVRCKNVPVQSVSTESPVGGMTEQQRAAGAAREGVQAAVDQEDESEDEDEEWLDDDDSKEAAYGANPANAGNGEEGALRADVATKDEDLDNNNPEASSEDA
jgi:hypothetical protein